MPLLESISAILVSPGVKVPLERAGAKQVMWKPPVLRPLPQGLVGILSLGLLAPPAAALLLLSAWPISLGCCRVRVVPAAGHGMRLLSFMTRSHFGHIPVILVAAQVSARNGAALMRWSLSYHKARS